MAPLQARRLIRFVAAAKFGYFVGSMIDSSAFPLFLLPDSARALRAQVREFIADELGQRRWKPQGDFTTAYDPAFSARLGQRGWLGMTWPKRYGGAERSMLERLVVTEELLAASAPVSAHWIADRQSGPLLLRFGSEAQRRRFLPAIARGEMFFSIGMSEPDAGSDLAAVRTRAQRVDGGWHLNGRKVWTTFAHRNHFAITLVRTGEAGESRHGGLSQFIVDLNGPGVTVRPIINMAGTHEFNEVVFDDAFVGDDCLLGELGNGWNQVVSELALERSGPERYLSSMRLLEAVARAAGATPRPRVAEALGRAFARLSTLRTMSYSVAAALQAGATPNDSAALIKDWGNSFERDVIDVARQLVPELTAVPAACPVAATAELHDSLNEALLYFTSWTLRGGTREVLRGIIARGLGLR